MLAQILIVFGATLMGLLYEEARTARCRNRHRDESDESGAHQGREPWGRVDRF